MHKDIIEVLLNSEEISVISKNMGRKITNDYKNSDLVLIGLLKGCIPFLADLSRNIDLETQISYMSVSSYNGGIKSSGEVKIKMDLDISITDKDCLIIEDIVDTANTITTVIDLLLKRGAKSVKVATLLDKPEGRIKPLQPAYVGKIIPNAFVVGYGLDYQEKYRNLPYVGILDPKIYKKY